MYRQAVPKDGSVQCFAHCEEAVELKGQVLASDPCSEDVLTVYAYLECVVVNLVPYFHVICYCNHAATIYEHSYLEAYATK